MCRACEKMFYEEMRRKLREELERVLKDIRR